MEDFIKDEMGELCDIYNRIKRRELERDIVLFESLREIPGCSLTVNHR